MSVKISIFKSSADGEQLNCEYNLEKRDFDRMEKGESLRSIFAPYFRLADDRLREMNLRIMIANKMLKGLPVELQMAYHNIMDVLHGQRPSDPQYSDMLKSAIHEVTESLIKQGVDPELVKKSIEASYGAIPSDEPQPSDEDIAEGLAKAEEQLKNVPS